MILNGGSLIVSGKRRLAIVFFALLAALFAFALLSDPAWAQEKQEEKRVSEAQKDRIERLTPEQVEDQFVQTAQRSNTAGDLAGDTATGRVDGAAGVDLITIEAADCTIASDATITFEDSANPGSVGVVVNGENVTISANRADTRLTIRDIQGPPTLDTNDEIEFFGDTRLTPDPLTILSSSGIDCGGNNDDGFNDALLLLLLLELLEDDNDDDDDNNDDDDDNDDNDGEDIDGDGDVDQDDELADEEDESDEDEDQDVSVTSDTDEDCIETTSETNTTNATDDNNAEDADTPSATPSSTPDLAEAASLERIDFETVAFQTPDPNDPDDTDTGTGTDEDEGTDTVDECVDDTDSDDAGGASASSGEEGSSADAGGASAQSDPDEQAPVSEEQAEEQGGDVVDEIPTEGPLPETGGASVAAGTSLALVLFGASLLVLRLVTARRGRRM